MGLTVDELGFARARAVVTTVRSSIVDKLQQGPDKPPKGQEIATSELRPQGKRGYKVAQLAPSRFVFTTPEARAQIGKRAVPQEKRPDSREYRFRCRVRKRKAKGSH